MGPVTGQQKHFCVCKGGGKIERERERERDDEGVERIKVWEGGRIN